jgi:NitT/TauT family transport system ATP-binding protein
MVLPATLGAARDALAHRVIRVAIRSKRFGATPVLGPIDFDIAAGETVALVGPSGIGKSTILNLVSGIDNDFEGTIATPERTAMVFQEPTLLPWRTALENLLLLHTGLTRASALEMLDSVGLSDKALLFPGQLSLGQQRRLALARAVAGAPEFLIMDEPFVSLDPDTTERVITLTEQFISDLRPALLLVTHARTEADRLADRIINLVGGPDGARPDFSSD